MSHTMQAFAAEAKRLDAADELAHFRDRFHFPPTPAGAVHRAPGTPSVYMCGNSLGLQPKRTSEIINEELTKWAKFGVEGHFEEPNPWVTVDELGIEETAAVVGAKPVEVVNMNTLTANLHLMMVAFYKPEGARFKIMIEGKAFPSDYHAVESQLKFHGYDPKDALVELFPRAGEDTLRTEDIEAAIAEQGHTVALVLISGIQYYTGQLFQIERIVKAGHAAGCMVGVDLAHAVGNAPLQLHDWDVDFACWCTYKYLNSGPGNIGGCFVHERHATNTSMDRFAGWWGHRKTDRFQMKSEFIPTPGAAGYQLSNPPVVCVAALRASLELFSEATMPRLRAKSVRLTAYLERIVRSQLADSVRIITPTDPEQRGAQLSIVFINGVPLRKMCDKLIEQGVIVDIREPDVMRVAPAPIYNSFQDVYDIIELISLTMAMVMSAESKL